MTEVFTLERRRNRKLESYWLLPDPVTPFFGESRFSYLKRISDANATKFDSFYTNTLCLKVRHLRRINYYLEPRIIDQLSKNIPLSKLQISKLGLDKWYDQVRNLPVFYLPTSIQRYCPVCLSENPYYQLNWSLGFMTACPKHQVMLPNKCIHENCNLRNQPWYLPWNKKLSLCNHCGQDLALSLSELPEKYILDDSDPFFAYQHILSNALETGYWKLENEEEIPIIDFLEGLQSIMRLVVRQWIVKEGIWEDTEWLAPFLKTIRSSLKLDLVIRHAKAAHIVTWEAVKALAGSEYSTLIEHDQAYFKRLTSGSCPDSLRSQRRLKHPKRSKVTESEVETAIQNPENEKEYVCLSSVANTIGCSFYTLLDRPRLKQLIESRRSPLVLKYLNRVEEALKLIKREGTRITKESVAERVGISVDTLNKYPKLLELIEQALENYKPKITFPRTFDIEEAKAHIPSGNIIQWVKLWINDLIARKETVSFRKVADLSGIYRQRLQEDPTLRELLEWGMKEQKIRLEQEVRACCEELLSKKLSVTITEVAELVGIDRKKITRNERLKAIIEEFRDRIDALISQIDDCIEQLVQKKELISYAKIADMVEFSQETISNNDEVRAKIAKAREHQKKKFQELLEKEVNRFLSEEKSITRRKIAHRLKIPYHTIFRNNDLEAIIQAGKKKEMVRLIQKVKASIEKLSKNKRGVSYKAVAEELGVYIYVIRQNNECRRMIDRYRN